MTKEDIDQMVALLTEIIVQDQNTKVMVKGEHVIDCPIAKLARQARAILVEMRCYAMSTTTRPSK